MIEKKRKRKLTPLRAIKQYCKVQCCVNDLKSWKECSVTNCYLYPYRFGKRDIDRKKENAIKKPMVLCSKNSTQLKGETQSRENARTNEAD